MSKTVAQRVSEAKGLLWIAPPVVKHGTEIITVNVGTDTGPSGKQSFSVHRNLLLASSSYFKAVVSHFREGVENRIELPEDVPQAFQVFYDWLYSGNASEQEGEMYETDHFWLLVYQLADHLMIAGVKVIAYERFRACFKPTESRILPGSRQILPTEDLVEALFDSDLAPPVFRVWVVEHILWYYHYSSDELTGADELVKEFPDFAAELGNALIKDKLDPTANRTHPSSDPSFAKKHGLDIGRLRVEARAAAGSSESKMAITLKRKRT